MIIRRLAISAGLMTGLLGSAQAQLVAPTSYDMPNGYSGVYNYWDDSYNGSGSTTTNGAPLTGGTGDLTDGVSAPDNWNVTEPPDGPGPYVGWTIDPTITFHFASAHDFEVVRIHFDDTNGAGGVSPASSVVINGTTFSVTDPASGAPFWAEFDVSGLLATDTLAIQVNRRSEWVFASEFTFGAPVPEPATLAALGLGLAATLRRRRRG